MNFFFLSFLPMCKSYFQYFSNINAIIHIIFLFLALKSVSSVPAPQNEEDEDGEYQKCVRFSPDNQFIVTGGSNGCCRVFKVDIFPHLIMYFRKF